MRRYHCVSFFFVTGVSHRSHRPATTCSLASTVWSFGHQLTLLSLRYARPRSNMRRKNHWFQR